MSTEKALARFAAEKTNYLEDLKTLVRIPSVSFAGFDPKHVRASAEAVKLNSRRWRDLSV